MEKKKAHHDLAKIQGAFAEAASLNITGTALGGAESLGISLEDIVAVIGGMTRKQHHRSMTSKLDNKTWQDVYHVPYGKTELYVKFTTDSEGKYLLISFKER